MEMHINYIAILVTVVATFILGFIWYTPLFGKAWAKELGLDTSGKAPAGALAKGMIFNVIGNFLLAYVFAHNLAAWSFVPDMKDATAADIILSSAIFTWLGFFLPVDLSAVAWENKSWKLFFINTGYHLVTLVVAAAI